ncbi:hypothetical protein [Vibrio sp. VB16]|nr:hypothetical protein [Vibrio sp. VB16]
MGHDLGAAYLSQIIAKQMVEEAIYGKSEPKRKSRIKALIKRMIK